MSRPNEELIYDRTQADVNNDTPKGQYNPSDVNRVETWCRYLADELNSVGYSITITTKTDWSASDMRDEVNMERIRSNIKKIQDGYYYITNIVASANAFDWRKANNFEKILHETEVLYEGMKAYYVHSGVATSGSSRVFQQRFRRY